MVQTIGEQQNISHFFEHWKTEHCRITEQTPTILILNMFGIPASTGFTNIFRPYFIENQAIQIKKIQYFEHLVFKWSKPIRSLNGP